jgi:hypothetical protein
VKRLVLLVGVAACGRAHVDDCSDDLAGVWHQRGDRGRGYDFRDSRSGGYEVFAMFDTAVPPDGTAKLASPIVYAPWVWDLDHRPSGLGGTRLQRLTRDGRSCEARTPIEIRTCAGDTLTIAVKLPTAMDFATCKYAETDWQELVLER